MTTLEKLHTTGLLGLLTGIAVTGSLFFLTWLSVLLFNDGFIGLLLFTVMLIVVSGYLGTRLGEGGRALWFFIGYTLPLVFILPFLVIHAVVALLGYGVVALRARRASREV